MSMYTAAISGLTFSLHERLKSHSSVPVRQRIKETQWEPTSRLLAEDVARIKPKVARQLRDASSEDLSWTDFWMVLERKANP